MSAAEIIDDARRVVGDDWQAMCGLMAKAMHRMAEMNVVQAHKIAWLEDQVSQGYIRAKPMARQLPDKPPHRDVLREVEEEFRQMQVRG